jgi:hypothetical protein
MLQLASAASAQSSSYSSDIVLAAEQKQEVIERIAGAKAIAATNQQLPFTLSCIDHEQSGACDGLGRQALSSLPLDRVALIRRKFDRGCSDGNLLCILNRRHTAYEVLLPFAAGNGYSWTVTVRPAQGLETILLYRSHTTFH